MNLRASQLETLRAIAEKPLNSVVGVEGGCTFDCAYVNYRTAEALERRGLITISREIDGEGFRAWECALTDQGREAVAQEGETNA